MIVLREMSGNPARAIVEGRAEKKFLHCAPLLPPPPVPRALVAYEDTVMARSSGTFTKPRAVVLPFWEKFHASRPGKFKSGEWVSFAERAGYSGSTGSLYSFLRAREQGGTLRWSNPGKKRAVWEFTTKGVQ